MSSSLNWRKRESNHKADRYGSIVICRNTGRFAMVMELNNYISPPKGLLLSSEETPLQCTVRKLKEELGYEMDLDILKVSETITVAPDIQFGIRYYTYYIVFVDEEFGMKSVSKEDSIFLKYRSWLTYAEIQKLRMSSFNTKAFIILHDRKIIP